MIRQVETYLLRSALKEARWNKAEAARILGIQKRLLYEKLSELWLHLKKAGAAGLRMRISHPRSAFSADG